MQVLCTPPPLDQSVAFCGSEPTLHIGFKIRVWYHLGAHHLRAHHNHLRAHHLRARISIAAAASSLAVSTDSAKRQSRCGSWRRQPRRQPLERGRFCRRQHPRQLSRSVGWWSATVLCLLLLVWRWCRLRSDSKDREPDDWRTRTSRSRTLAGSGALPRTSTRRSRSTS